MAKCHVDNCEKDVSKAGHKLCYEHWQDERNGVITECDSCGKYKNNDYPLCLECHKKKKAAPAEDAPKGKGLNSTAIGKEFDLSSRKVNLILAELGWIKEALKGWEVTPQGRIMNAQNLPIKF